MNRFFENLLKPDAALAEDELQYWRGRITSILLISAVVLGAFALGYAIFYAVTNQGGIWLITYSLAYIFILIITLMPKAPYYLRSGTILVILFFLGLVSSLQSGAVGVSSIWFIGFSILAGVLWNLSAGLIASAISIVVSLLVALLTLSNLFDPKVLEILVMPLDMSPLLGTMIPFIIVAAISLISANLLITGLQRVTQKVRLGADAVDLDQAATETESSDLVRRENQLRTAAEISRAISSELDQDLLFSRVVNLIKERFNLYYAGVFLVDPGGLFAVLREGTGEEGQAMLEDEHKLPIDESSMVGWAVNNRIARIALDVETEIIRAENPYLPDTRSELALPLISGDRVLGALTIQSDLSGAFDDEDIIVLQGVADSLSIAIENARLFTQAELNLQEIHRLHRQYMRDSWKDEFDRSGQHSFEYKNPELATLASVDSSPAHKITKPIVLRNQVIGSIILETNRPGFNPEEETLIDAVANQAALALENTRLVEVTQRSAQQDRIISDLSSKVWASSNIDTILRTAISEMVRTLDASDGIINLDISEIS